MKFFKKTRQSILCISITTFVSLCILVISLTGFILAANKVNCYSQSFHKTLNALFYPYATQIADDFANEYAVKDFLYQMDDYFDRYDSCNIGIQVTKDGFSTATDSFDRSNIIYSNNYYYLKYSDYNQPVSFYTYNQKPQLDKYYITLDISVNHYYPYDDEYHDIYTVYKFIDNYKYAFIICGILSISIITFCIVYMGIAYHNCAEPVLKFGKWLDLFPPSVLLLICTGLIALTGFAYTQIIISITYMNVLTTLFRDMSLLTALLLIISLSGALIICNTTRLISGRQFFNRFILVRAYRSFNTFGKGTLIGIVTAVIMIIFSVIGFYTNPLFTVIPILVVLGLWIWFMTSLKKLDTAIDRFSHDEWSYDDSHSSLIIGNIYDNLRLVSTSMQSTIEQSIRNERTKTELITNVSHDIKTPLTSIINYTDLLGRDNLTEEERTQYLDVLTKSSARMKKLLEDLIEVSKASTGNIELHMMNCNIRTLLAQSVAEYSDIALLNKLKIVPDKGEDEIILNTDSSKLFRVFDNILSNACKYSIQGSRIYIYVTLINNEVQISFVNTSANEITISAGELTERFVRGDLSRNTEGSGLGLAIAKSLTELLGGSLNITIDGDQFRITLTFALSDSNSLR